eukprot:Blabericola_migrator_1__4374@NODE_234_length_11037_cov_77_854421_g199_i0_p9_GENE_NODE_234_length_11037_cov_77_854421_g199_i0NODE_234_length_11037_cov_77_854421_g199_i0_p9_ORF_typecomplete_len112_score11_11PUL/PF08324_11/0_025_NODE_234_length_11037_cov_77_854421_g199_i031993534
MRHRYRYRSTRRAMETIRASIKSLRGLTDDGDAVGGYIQSLGTTCRQLTSLNAEHVLLSYDIWNLAALNPVINTNASHRVEGEVASLVKVSSCPISPSYSHPFTGPDNDSF